MGINLPNGGTVEEIVLPNGSQASEVIGPDGSTVWERVAIPEGSVSRTNDKDTFTRDLKRGIQIELYKSYPKIGVEISSMTSGISTAYCYQISDGSLIDEVDVSDLQAGDTFAFVGPFASGRKYQLVADNGGADYDCGTNNLGNDVIFEGESVEIDIVDGAINDTSDSSEYANFVTVGDVGL